MMLRVKNATAFLFILSLAFSASAFPQDSEKPIKMRDLPEAVRKTVQEQRKGATLRGLSKEVKDGNTFYEAELKVKGHTKDVLMDPSGTVIEIEEQVALSSLPAEVRAALLKNAGKGKITLVESITKNNTLEAYEAHVSRAGKRLEIKVTHDGRLISAEQDQDKDDHEASEKRSPVKTKKP